MAYHKKIRRGGATMQTACRRRNPEGRPDIHPIVESFVVTDALVSITSSSLLVPTRRDSYLRASPPRWPLG